MNFLKNIVLLDTSGGVQAAWEVFFGTWKGFIAFMAGAGALTSVLVFIVLMVRLGKVGDNPAERSAVLRDLLIALVIAALLGSSSLVLTLFIETVTLPS